jgi:hypothetical protein
MINHKLLNEFLSYNPFQGYGMKAYRVYVLCLRRKRNLTAAKITRKYGHLFPQQQHDIVVAFGWMMKQTKIETK